jgi:hypothetical protein
LVRLQWSSKTLVQANGSSGFFVALFKVVQREVRLPMAYPEADLASWAVLQYWFLAGYLAVTLWAVIDC